MNEKHFHMQTVYLHTVYNLLQSDLEKNGCAKTIVRFKHL